MTFLNRICTICLFILLMIYNADSNKWRTKELEDNINYSLNYSSLRKIVEPLAYKIYFISESTIFEKDNATFRGDTAIFFIIKYPIMQINLNAHGLTIKKEEVHLMRFPYQDIYYLRNLSYVIETETLILDFETEIPSGFYLMYIEFIGNISGNETGLYRTTCKDCTGASKWIFVAQLKPTAARRVFPCWDESIFRSRFAIEITHYRNYTSLSNMPIREKQNINNNLMKTKFHATPPIPTYLVAFALMDSVCSTNKEDYFTTRMCSTSLVKQEHMAFALKTSAHVIAYLHFFMRTLPQFVEITHIGLPDFSYEAAGNWGFNIYRENHLIYNETLHPIDRKLNISMYVSSLVALQWVGNLVSPTSWTHMWFCQTLALFYGVKAFTKTHSDEDITSLLTYRIQSLARENHVVSEVKPVMHPADNRDEIDRLMKTSYFTNCLKEYAIIAMFESAVNEISLNNLLFQSAITNYLKTYQFSTATPNDFWDILQDIIEERKILPSYFSIAQAVQNWLKLESLPVVTVSRNHTDNHTEIVISSSYGITRESDTENTPKLWIPINYITKSSLKNISYFVLLTPRSKLLSDVISPFDWIVVNWQYTGYYRVKYDTLSLQILAKHLESDKRTEINVLNRAHIIEDAYYFLTKEKLNISMFLHLIHSMSNEEQCAPWYAMQNIVQKMWPFFNMDIGTHAKSVIVHVFAKLLLKVGYLEHPDDTDCVKFKRLLAMKWACRLHHLPCLEIARLKLIAHLDVPELKTIWPMWEEWTYCNGLMLSESWVWTKVYQEYQETRNKRLLKYFACSENIIYVRDYLELFMLNNSIISNILVVKSEDRQNIYRFIVRKYTSKNEVLDYILEKMMRIEIDDEFIENIHYVIENVYSRHQLSKILVLLNKNLRSEFKNELIYKMNEQLTQITIWESLVNGK